MGDLLDAFGEVWVVDYEFRSAPGERPDPVCLVAWELRTGRKVRLWREDFGRLPPYSTKADSLFIAYYAPAELGCHLSLGWPMPARILDLFVEFRCLTNGEEVPAGNSLLGALTYYGLDNIGGAEKDEMRNLVLRGEKQEAILNYCESDVSALARLLPRMLPRIDLPRALFRGRYMAAAARPPPRADRIRPVRLLPPRGDPRCSLSTGPCVYQAACRLLWKLSGIGHGQGVQVRRTGRSSAFTGG